MILYTATALGIRKINKLVMREIHEYPYRGLSWEKPPGGEKICEVETKEQAFAAMRKYVQDAGLNLPYTFIKKRSDGIYIAFFDDGRDKDGLEKHCADFILIDK